LTHGAAMEALTWINRRHPHHLASERLQGIEQPLTIRGRALPRSGVEIAPFATCNALQRGERYELRPVTIGLTIGEFSRKRSTRVRRAISREETRNGRRCWIEMATTPSQPSATPGLARCAQGGDGKGWCFPTGMTVLACNPFSPSPRWVKKRTSSPTRRRSNASSTTLLRCM
jgi:hypothetical protein